MNSMCAEYQRKRLGDGGFTAARGLPLTYLRCLFFRKGVSGEHLPDVAFLST